MGPDSRHGALPRLNGKPPGFPGVQYRNCTGLAEMPVGYHRDVTVASPRASWADQVSWAARRSLEKRYPGFPAQYLCIRVLISLYRALSRPCALLGFLEFRCCLCRLPQCIGRHRCTIKIEDFARLGVTDDPGRPPAPVVSPTPRRTAGVHRRLAVAEFGLYIIVR